MKPRSFPTVPAGYIDQTLVDNAQMVAPKVALTLKLELAKQDYIQLEPILASLVLDETTATRYSVSLLKTQCAGAMDILQVEEGGALKRVAGAEYCYEGRRRAYRPRDQWSWKFKALGRRHWVQNNFPPGKVTFRAVLTLWEPRVQFISNDVTIDVHEPAGLDLEAYKFLSSRQPIDLDGKPIPAATILDTGFSRTPESANWEEVHRAFVAQFPASLYASYVRYTMAGYLSGKVAEATEDEREDAVDNYVSMLGEIIQNAPAEFPWVGQIYYQLIRHYKLRGDTAKFREL